MVNKILNKALNGDSITPDEANILMDSGKEYLDKLLETSNILTKRNFDNFDNKITMCAIYPAKVGRCSGDCAFCAQSAHHNSNVVPVDVSMLNETEIIENARELYNQGVSRYSLVTSGEYLTDKEFNHILHILKRLKNETHMRLCASLGSLTIERAKELKNIGVTRYHHNIETSRSYFPKICSTHSYDDKLNTISIARKVGMEVCSGGIIAMGETPYQRVEMAFALKELDVDSVPINILNPIKGTRLEYEKPLEIDEILRTISVFRLIMPNKTLRFAGGRENAMGAEEYKGYLAGINSMIVGNYLTTLGKSVHRELYNLQLAGLV